MSEQNGKPLDPVELVSLPPDDPYRQKLMAGLNARPADDKQRQRWERELALTDRLRRLLPQVTSPTDMETRLLTIPEKESMVSSPAAPTSGKNARGFRGILRYAAAAILLLMVGICAYFYWPRSEATPEALNPALARQMADWAVKSHETSRSASLEIASADPATVQKALAAHGEDFPVIMLKPDNAKATLVGGGTCDFGPAKAVFTRWKLGDAVYSLFEFNGKDLQVPAIFLQRTETPRDLWNGDNHYRVSLWPGQQGKCCWALVMETDNAPNVFGNSAYTAW